MTTYKGTLLEDQREAHDWATPFMVSASDTAASLLNEPPCQLNFVVFSAACKKDVAVNPAMKRVNELTQSSALRDRLLQEFAPPKNQKDQKMNKVPEDIERVILFGHGMECQSISVEAFCVSSLRIYTSGEALVATCPYSGVADYAATNLPDKPQNIPFGRLRNEVFCNIEPDQWDELAKQTKLRTTHVVAPAVVYVPLGHVMIEKSINNTQSFGVQVGFVHDSGMTDCQVQSFKRMLGLSDGIRASGAGERQLEVTRTIRQVLMESESCGGADGKTAPAAVTATAGDAPGDGDDECNDTRDANSLGKRQNIVS